MNKYVRKISMLLISLFLFMCFYSGCVYAQDKSSALQPYVESFKQSQAGMTLWELINAGGFIMIVLMGLSVVALTLVIYNFSTTNEKKLLPAEFSEMVIQKLESKDGQGVREICSLEDNIISRVVLSGLNRKKRGGICAKEAMENCAKKEISLLWQNITYLADIAAVAPLVGLLGTVLGMIQAFNVIAFQTAVVKPILLAGGVSKAMITTAGGLIVAIPVIMFYSYLRGRVQRISTATENYSADIIKLVGELK